MIFNKDYMYMGKNVASASPFLAYNCAHGGNSLVTPYTINTNYPNATFITLYSRAYSAQSSTAVTYTISSGENSFEISKKANSPSASDSRALIYGGNLEINSSLTSQTTNNVIASVALKKVPDFIATTVKSQYRYSAGYMSGAMYYPTGSYITPPAGNYDVWCLSIGDESANARIETPSANIVTTAECLYTPTLKKITLNGEERVTAKSTTAPEIIEGSLIALFYKSST